MVVNRPYEIGLIISMKKNIWNVLTELGLAQSKLVYLTNKLFHEFGYFSCSLCFGENAYKHALQGNIKNYRIPVLNNFIV